jgi:alpha-L-rhamnosidase
MIRRFTIALLASAMLVAPALADELSDGFQDPPSSARPRVWWHWMNGNVTIDGIDKDLAWMERVGIGGLQNFDANLATPQIVPKRLVYMDDGWKAAFKHAVQTADKKGLEFAIAASPGWSETGGPWVKPEDGMKKLVWSETIVTGGKRFNGNIAPAPNVTGPWQQAQYFDFIAMMGGGKPPEPKRASGDVAVIAVPAAAALPVPQLSSTDGKALDWSKLSDADPQSTVDVPTGSNDVPGGIVLTYPKPVTVQSLRLYIPHAKPPFGSAPYQPVIEAEVDGGWKTLGAVSLGEASSTTGFALTTAQRFRILLARNTDAKSAGLGGGAPGAESFDIFAQSIPTSIKVGDVKLSGDARVNHAEAKAGFDIVNDYNAIADSSTASGLASTKLIDLTSKLKVDGTLDWTPPKGTDWRIYRFGWSLTGKTNHPAPPEATGLEVDKYDAAAVRRYVETYLGMYRDTVGADLMGAKGIRALLTDSIEVGPSNWTPQMPKEFKTRRGYDLMPWLPEKFLYDYRTTLADLLADAHYGTVAKVAHEHGLKVYGEAHENGRPVLGDDLAMRSNADVPMAALWTWGEGEKPRSTLVGDMKGAASVAHVYGQNIVAAESMTAANSPWAFSPADLKPVIDLEFASGVNRPVIHTSVHQPVDDKKPGLSLMIFGQYFNRHDSWAEMAKPWVDYISRTSYMLQQGRNHADIAYFYGEESPVTGVFEFDTPKGLPTQYAYDFVNSNMLRDALSVEDGEIVAKGGARYKALYLGGRSDKMTLPTLQRIAAMVDAGATVIGQKPTGSPSLHDDAAEFAALADRLWKDGRVIPSNDIEASLTKAGTSPDFSYAKPQPDSEILFVHRKLADGDVYFLNNRNNRAESIQARFRVTGKQPELWNAITGTSTPLSFTVDGNETVVPLELKPEDAAFVVFRKPLEGGVTGAAVAASAPTQSAPLSALWSVAFQPGRAAPASISMPTLKPLNESTDAGVKYFSGTATYTTSFAIPKKAKVGAPLWLDLGKIGDVAEVRVNGKEAGTVWFAPNRVNIGKLVKKGTNALEIRVANLWVNRLIGDKQPGAEKITFTAAPTYKPDAPLRPSGLIGPVKLEY